MLNLLLAEVVEQYARENFRRLQLQTDTNPVMNGDFVLRLVSLRAATMELEIPHGLSFLPQDILITRQTGTGTLTIHYDQTTTENFVVSSTGPVEARLLVGTLR